MLPRETDRNAKLGKTVNFADQKAKPVSGTLDIFASSAMFVQCFDGIRSLRRITVNCQSGFTSTEHYREIMSSPVSSGSTGEIFHSSVELLDRIFIHVEQEKAKADQVWVRLVFDLINHPSGMRAGKFGQNAIRGRHAGNALAPDGHRSIKVKRALIRHHHNAGLILKPEVAAQVKAKDREFVNAVYTFGISYAPVDVAEQA